MSEMTAEQFGQRAFDLGLIDIRQLESVWSELGSHDVPPAEFQKVLLRKGLLTNWQIERLSEGKKTGFVYGQYRVLYSIGAGTFARVYRSEHVESKKVVAVKVLRQRYSQDIVKTEQFLREASVVIPLKHPNIVPIHEVKTERGRSYMVMDFVEGQNLRDFVKVHNQLTVEDSLRLATDIVAGLDYAFQKGITHRDIKLSNVLLSSRGQARLVDFGLASYEGKLTDAALQDVPNARSIDYAALERASGVRKDDKRSDLYFVGCMLYQMLTGLPPLKETRDRLQRLNVSRFNEIKPITTLMPNLSHRVMMLVNKSLELKADQRYQTPAEMLADLKAASQALESSDSPNRPEVVNSAEPAAQANGPEVVRNEGESFTVMLVESNVNVQTALRDRLKKLGYRVLVIADPQRALQRFEADESAADCVIFGTADLGVAALQAFNQFAEDENTTEIPAILLVDTRQKKLAEKQASLAKHRVIVTIPLKFREIRESLYTLIAARKSSPPA